MLKAPPQPTRVRVPMKRETTDRQERAEGFIKVSDERDKSRASAADERLPEAAARCGIWLENYNLRDCLIAEIIFGRGAGPRPFMSNN
jgi:hypothetical protein